MSFTRYSLAMAYSSSINLKLLLDQTLKFGFHGLQPLGEYSAVTFTFLSQALEFQQKLYIICTLRD